MLSVNLMNTALLNVTIMKKLVLESAEKYAINYFWEQMTINCKIDKCKHISHKN